MRNTPGFFLAALLAAAGVGVAAYFGSQGGDGCYKVGPYAERCPNLGLPDLATFTNIATAPYPGSTKP